MDTINDDFNLEGDSSETQLASNDSTNTDSAILSPDDSNIFMPLSSSDSISEETYTRQLTDYVHELKAELQTRCQLDWLSKFEPSEHNPKVELNLLLHGAIREQTLKQIALSKGIHFRNDEHIIAEIFQNDYCLFQRIFQEIVHDQRQQRIIYTEILFRPDMFNFDHQNSSVKLKDVIEVIIDCIRFFTSTNITTKTFISPFSSLNLLNTIIDKQTENSFIPYGITPLPLHIKIILSCNWNNVQIMNKFIHLARNYSDEIVGIDFYGEEDECRQHWHDFYKYTKILHHYNIRYQASMNNYKDLQLIIDVITGLAIERLSEAYEITQSSKYIETILIKHAVHLVICPLSNAYKIANHQANDVWSRTGKKRKYQSTSSLDNLKKENDSNENLSYKLINDLQSELINYSLASLSPMQYKQNLSFIYKNLFEINKNVFTCEHMQCLNENALKSSFASQKLKTELIKYIRENYRNCYKQTILLKQFQETTNKWQQEMNEIIDKNAQIAVEFAKKIHQEKHLNHQQEIQTKLFDEDAEVE